MYIKSFVTIFLALFYIRILTSNITTDKEATIAIKLTVQLLTWFIQAVIGANIVCILYNMWS